ncbi:GNAT family N-acetyltransferase [Streptomyces sp. NBC_00638]|uniref:GNAT family N-acetyltransferase n=1 Tax=Streptomyces sp. NBC_00638 TaxID=2975794 RepID=UPI00225A45BF|nr:GNAT family N-acetyltransferase [Streptomyces sp. NBC_00638]MCX5001509.1 GNAT family N-acetyltransferase [Streptomyces sp. NBC_00638]
MPRLEALSLDHAAALLAFERENRAYFAASISDRGDAYFAEFDVRLRELLADQAAGLLRFHVVVDDTGAVLGRFNLVDVAEGSAELGYRVAERSAGRGLATATVREVCALAASAYGLRTLRAVTTADNAASRTVLARTGFLVTGGIDLNGRPGLRFARDLSAAGDAPAGAGPVRESVRPRD